MMQLDLEMASISKDPYSGQKLYTCYASQYWTLFASQVDAWFIHLPTYSLRILTHLDDWAGIPHLGLGLGVQEGDSGQDIILSSRCGLPPLK